MGPDEDGCHITIIPVLLSSCLLHVVLTVPAYWILWFTTAGASVSFPLVSGNGPWRASETQLF